MPRRIPSLEKLENLTGFRPTTPLVEIVDRVVAHCRTRKEARFRADPDRLAAQAASD
jgi:hypothetical protein